MLACVTAKQLQQARRFGWPPDLHPTCSRQALAQPVRDRRQEVLRVWIVPEEGQEEAFTRSGSTPRGVEVRRPAGRMGACSPRCISLRVIEGVPLLHDR